MTDVTKLKLKIFADGADVDGIKKMYANPLIKGFTTNPTLMRKAGIDDYEAFAKSVLAIVSDRPVSFEVFADDFPTMERQARRIAAWGANVNVKIPITNTKGESAGSLVRRLSGVGIVGNARAMMTLDQAKEIAAALDATTPAIVSVFAGRIADTGRDPMPLMAEAAQILKVRPKAELLWASPRELLNIFQADAVGCHIITATNDVLAKLSSVGKALDEFSLDTVKMFHRDASAAGYTLGS